MKLPVLVHRARLGAEEFRVVRPAPPVRRAVVIDHDRHLDVHVDQDAAVRIAGLWALAARSRRSLIHLPLRANRPPDGGTPGDGGRQLDLVLLHHTLRFPPARWKRVRALLGPGRPHTAWVPEVDRDGAAPPDHPTRHHRENRDLLHQHVHAETLFVTGSATVFRATVHHFHGVAVRGPRAGGGHVCSTVRADEGVLGDAREIHVAYRAQWDG